MIGLRLILICLLSLEVVSQQCIQNCSTVSTGTVNSSLTSTVSCSISDETCAFTRRGTPHEPKDTTEGNGWYLYEDPDNKGCEKIALNFSWGPQHEASVNYLDGYSIDIFGPHILDNSRSAYFCFNHHLDFFKHLLANFYYNCFGRSDGLNIKPGQEFKVLIRSIPPPKPTLDDRLLEIDIRIPSCRNKKLKNVYECRLQREMTMNVSTSCEKQKVLLSYHIPNAYGSSASIMLKHQTHMSGTSRYKPISHLQHQPLSANQTEISLPDTYGLHDNYSIEVWGTSVDSPRRKEKFNLHECALRSTLSGNSLLPIFIVLPLVFVIAVAVLVACFCLKLDVKKIRSWYKSDTRNLHETVEHDSNFSMVKDNVMKQELENQKIVKIYLLFVNDHRMHKMAVFDFANFLRGDLGFDVSCEIYKQGEIFEDPIGWMEKSFDESDKIIVVWSPGASRRWNQYNNGQIMENDMFSPVLKKIKVDIFRNINLDKYFFVYFDYCSEADIPDAFKESRETFKVMTQFEKLYFQLKNLEKYMAGGVTKLENICVDRYFDPKLNRYGAALRVSICNMRALVKDNPDWHLMENTRATQIQGHNIAGAMMQDKLMPNHIDVHPPVPLQAMHPARNTSTMSNVDQPCSSANVHDVSTSSEHDDNISIGCSDTEEENEISFMLAEQEPSVNVMPNNISLTSYLDSGFQDASVTINEPNQQHASYEKPMPQPQEAENNRVNVGSQQQVNVEQFPVLTPLEHNYITDSKPFNDCSSDDGYSTYLPSITDYPSNVSMPFDSLPTSNFVQLVPLDMDIDPCDALESINSGVIPSSQNHGNNRANQKGKPVVEIVPVDTETDPMLSFMAINNQMEGCV